MKRPTVVAGISFYFILLFTYAAVMKLWTYQQFKSQLGLSPPVSAYANWLVIIVPAVEVLVVIALRFPKTRLAALYGCFLLMVMFTTYIVLILRFSQYVPCSCGGVLEDMSWGQHLVFNIICTGLAAVGVILYPVRQQTQYVLGKWVLKS